MDNGTSLAGGGMAEEDESIGTKYLTAAPLLELQLRDPAFRRHFLLQCAILLGFCDNPPPATTAAGAGLKINKEQAAAAKKRVMAQLTATPPHGADFAAAVSHVLCREQGGGPAIGSAIHPTKTLFQRRLSHHRRLIRVLRRVLHLGYASLKAERANAQNEQKGGGDSGTRVGGVEKRQL